MKRILCYGDSNTYGFDAESGARFPENLRWPTVMGRELGSGVHVREEGCNGRTIHDVVPYENPLNGTSSFPFLIEQHNPLALIIIYLGINDLFLRKGLTVTEISHALENLILMSRGRSDDGAGIPAQILILAPPPVNVRMREASLYRSEIAESRRFAEEYRNVAERNNCHFIDAGSVVEATTLDGVHLDSGSHRKLGAHVASFLKARKLP